MTAAAAAAPTHIWYMEMYEEDGSTKMGMKERERERVRKAKKQVQSPNSGVQYLWLVYYISITLAMLYKYCIWQCNNVI